jgi:hypothetical protein
MELGIIGALAYIGNNYYSENDDQNNDVNQDSLDNYHHNIDFTYHDNAYEKNTNKIKYKNDIISKSQDPQKTNIINNSIKSINNISVNYKDMNSNFYDENVKNLDNIKMFESFNDKLNNSNESYEDQFKPLVFDNKSKPVSQNEGGSSAIDRNKFNSVERNLAIGDDYSLFDNESDMTYGVTSNKDFTHSNMVPHFAKKQMINKYNEQTIAHKVDIFSGSSKNYVPKKELLLENFAPVQKDVNLVGGSQSKLEFMQSYYLPSKEKKNILPFEQQQVGPGLNLAPDQTARADGGNQEDYRPLPKTVDQLRSSDRPKESYPGVIIPGQKGNKGQIIGEVFKRRPEKTKEVDPRTFQRTGGVNSKPSSRDSVILKNTTRKASKPMVGPAFSNVEKRSNKNNSKIRESTKKETASSGPSNARELINKHTQNKCSYKLPDTQRETTGGKTRQPNPYNLSLGTVIFDPHDLPRQTIKQTTLYNEHTGAAEAPTKSNKTFDPTQTTRVTRKQTTLFNEQGGIAQGESTKVGIYNPNDVTRPTLRQDTTFNEQSGIAQGISNKVGMYNPNDVTKPTLRQDMVFNEQTGYAQGISNKTGAYNPDDVTKPTLRQDMVFNEQTGYAQGISNKTGAYNPDDITKPTLRQDMVFNEQSGYAQGVTNKVGVYNPDDIMRPTTRQDTQYNDQLSNVKGMENKNQSHNPEDILRFTQRQDLAYNNDKLNVRGEVNMNQMYDPNDITRHTQREDQVHNQNISNTQGEVNMGQVYDPSDITKQTHREELVHTSHLNHVKSEIDAPIYFDPSDVSKQTIKELSVYPERQGHVMSNNTKPGVFDPSDIPATTLKELLVYQYNLGVAQGSVNKGITFNPNDIPAETLKEMIVMNNYISNANQKDSKGGYLSNKFDAPETLRQLMQVLRFGGALGDQAPRDYSAERNMEFDDRKETAIQSRNPTNRKHDTIPTTATNLGDMHLRDNLNIERSPLIDRVNYHSNNFNLPSKYTQNTYIQEESNRLNPEILNQLNSNPLVNNIVISQPDNSDYNNC